MLVVGRAAKKEKFTANGYHWCKWRRDRKGCCVNARPWVSPRSTKIFRKRGLQGVENGWVVGEG